MKTTEDYPLHHNLLKRLDDLPIDFGGYRLDSVVSNGNAVVFKAFQKDPERTVALKIPKFGVLDSKSARDQFRTEYAFAAGLRHSSIVPVLEVGQWEGVPYYTMPFIEGNSLLDHALIRQVSLQEKIELFKRICGVVCVLHESGLIHRDLKSENILIDQYGEVALLDFGLAHVFSDDLTKTDGKYVAGTVRYMSPEQASGLPPEHLGFQSDVFSLGVVGFKLFSGKFPFELPENKVLALERVKACDIRFEPLETSKTPRFLREIIRQALSKDLLDRPENAEKLLRLLEQGEKPWYQKFLRKDSIALLFVFALGLFIGLWGGISLWLNLTNP